MANISSIGGNPIVPAAVQPNSVTDAMLVQTGGVLEQVTDLTDIDVGTLIDGYYIGPSGGMSAHNQYKCTDYIDIRGLSAIQTQVLYDSGARTYFYDSFKNSLAAAPYPPGATGMSTEYVTFSVPDGAAYVRSCIAIGRGDGMVHIRATDVGGMAKKLATDNYPYAGSVASGFLAIKDMRVRQDITESVKVLVRQITRHYTIGANTVHSVTVSVFNQDGTVVNDWVNILNIRSTNYDERSYNEFSVAVGSHTLSGFFYIDWSEIPDATAVANGRQYIQQQLIEYSDNSAGAVMFVPPKLYGVVGKTYYLRHYNMTKFLGQDRGEISGNSGFNVTNLGDRYKVSPSAAGNISLNMYLYKDLQRIQTDNITLKAVADNPSAALKAVFIGDSMTDQKTYIAQLMYLLPNMGLIGTRSGNAVDSTDTTRLVHHEGRSSWSAWEYVTVASKNNTANAFWNPSTSKFDFSYYMSTNGYSGLTDAFVMLGTNDVGRTDAWQSNFVTAMQEIVASIVAYDSSISVHIILPPPPIDSGYGWGTRNANNVQAWKNLMFDLWELVKANLSSYDIIPAGLNVDCWYDFPRTTVQVNENNPATMEVGNENVHPNRYGYYNIADVIYAHIIGTR